MLFLACASFIFPLLSSITSTTHVQLNDENRTALRYCFNPDDHLVDLLNSYNPEQNGTGLAIKQFNLFQKLNSFHILTHVNNHSKIIFYFICKEKVGYELSADMSKNDNGIPLDCFVSRLYRNVQRNGIATIY